MNNLAQDLHSFTGTEHYYRLTALANFNATDGVKYVAEKYGAYWLIDAIASYQHNRNVRTQDFQFWKLTVNNSAAILTMTDGNSDTPIVRQKIEFTDFPGNVEFYLTDNVLMLPSEY